MLDVRSERSSVLDSIIEAGSQPFDHRRVLGGNMVKLACRRSMFSCFKEMQGAFEMCKMKLCARYFEFHHMAYDPFEHPIARYEDEIVRLVNELFEVHHDYLEILYDLTWSDVYFLTCAVYTRNTEPFLYFPQAIHVGLVMKMKGMYPLLGAELIRGMTTEHILYPERRRENRNRGNPLANNLIQRDDDGEYVHTNPPRMFIEGGRKFNGNCSKWNEIVEGFDAYDESVEGMTHVNISDGGELYCNGYPPSTTRSSEVIVYDDLIQQLMVESFDTNEELTGDPDEDDDVLSYVSLKPESE